jgi:hypothetical protein
MPALQIPEQHSGGIMHLNPSGEQKAPPAPELATLLVVVTPPPKPPSVVRDSGFSASGPSTGPGALQAAA